MSPKRNDTTAKDVDKYLAKVPDGMRALLKDLRATIKKTAPKATEGISYGIPFFRLDGHGLVWYAAWKHHASIYPITSKLLAEHERDLKGYKYFKGTIQFKPDKPLPAKVVRTLVESRIEEIDSES